MASYPNRDALRDAHDIYLNAMQPFITKNAIDVIETEIDIDDIAHIITKDWFDSFKQWFDDVDPYYQARGAAWQIVESRNRASHPPWDLDIEFTRAHLFLIANLLEKINRSDAKREVENIRDQLCSDEVEEHPAEVENADLKERLADRSEQLAAVESEKTECEKRLQDVQKRLEDLKEIETDWIATSDQLEKMKSDQVDSEEKYQAILSDLKASEGKKKEFEEHLETTLKQLEKAEADWLVSDERLKDTLQQLKDTKAEKDKLGIYLETVEKKRIALEKQLKAMPDPLETEKAAKAAYEKGFKTASKKLAALESVKAELEERLGTKSIQLEEVEAKLITYKDELEFTLEQLAIVEAEKTEIEEHLAEIEEHSLLTNNTPDSVIFQETTFTKYSNKYYVAGRYINQAFWSYWHAQGREGKEEMRNAGWSVEKADDHWEITILPEDLQAWIKNKKLTAQPTAPFHERAEEPVLVFLSDKREHRREEIINLLTERFLLNEDARSALSNSGRIEKHLMSKGLIERTRTGYYRITSRGLDVIIQNEYDIPF